MNIKHVSREAPYLTFNTYNAMYITGCSQLAYKLKPTIFLVSTEELYYEDAARR